MNTYQKEHFDTYRLVMNFLGNRPASERRSLIDLSADYVDFRKRLDRFQQAHVAELCADKCYRTHESMCCSRDSIVVYFADVVVNCLHSEGAEIDRIISVLESSNTGHQCIYLTAQGCRWRILPIVCGMFLCDAAASCISEAGSTILKQWQDLAAERLRYTWPDRPVVFDALEKRFLAHGLNSVLMHLNSSPGLLALKRKAGLLNESPLLSKGTKPSYHQD